MMTLIERLRASADGFAKFPHEVSIAEMMREAADALALAQEALEIVGCIIRDNEAPNDALSIIEETIGKPREDFTGTITDADARIAGDAP